MTETLCDRLFIRSRALRREGTPQAELFARDLDEAAEFIRAHEAYVALSEPHPAKNYARTVTG